LPTGFSRGLFVETVSGSVSISWGILPILFMTVFEFFSQPVSNGLSRYFEYQADEFGYRLSEVSVDDARVVFEKLSAYNLSDPEPSPVIEFWFYDHPALSKRIENIQKLNENMPPGV